MKTLDQLLAESAALHHHLCPRQVLGVQMGRLVAHLLDLDLPQSDKRLLTIVETDGCFTSGLSVATNCWVGRRTMRVEDYGKVAATFVDTATGQAIRIAPSLRHVNAPLPSSLKRKTAGRRCCWATSAWRPLTSSCGSLWR
jgi:formylmethanofuran dehydrogenase subunit E